jgi:hypothetical protein
VTVRELTGAERDRIYAEQARRYPGFAEYARQTAGGESPVGWCKSGSLPA